MALLATEMLAETWLNHSERKHTLGFDVFCVKMINQILQETLANHVLVGLMCTSETIKVWRYF